MWEAPSRPSRLCADFLESAPEALNADNSARQRPSYEKSASAVLVSNTNQLGFHKQADRQWRVGSTRVVRFYALRRSRSNELHEQGKTGENRFNRWISETTFEEQTAQPGSPQAPRDLVNDLPVTYSTSFEAACTS